MSSNNPKFILATIMVTGMLIACSGLESGSDESSSENTGSGLHLGACSLLSDPVIEKNVGPIFDRHERSWTMSGGEITASCQYSGFQKFTKILSVDVLQATPKDVSDWTSDRRCQTRLPLGVAGVDGYLCGEPDEVFNFYPYLYAVAGPDPSYLIKLSVENVGSSAPTASIDEAGPPLRDALQALLPALSPSTFKEK